SLVLFTPRRYDSLPGLAFAGDPDGYPTRDEVIAYLEQYVAAFEFPVELGNAVRSLDADGGRFVVALEDRQIEADQVVVATGPFQLPRVPALADQLNPDVFQAHSTGYRRPRKPDGVELKPRAIAVSGRTVSFADGSELDVDAVIWATGYRPNHSWINLPVADPNGGVRHRRGVTDVPGLYFLGLSWQHTRGSALLGWVKHDAGFIAEQIDAFPEVQTTRERDNARPSAEPKPREDSPHTPPLHVA